MLSFASSNHDVAIDARVYMEHYTPEEILLLLESRTSVFVLQHLQLLENALEVGFHGPHPAGDEDRRPPAKLEILQDTQTAVVEGRHPPGASEIRMLPGSLGSFDRELRRASRSLVRFFPPPTHVGGARSPSAPSISKHDG